MPTSLDYLLRPVTCLLFFSKCPSAARRRTHARRSRSAGENRPFLITDVQAAIGRAGTKGTLARSLDAIAAQTRPKPGERRRSVHVSVTSAGTTCAAPGHLRGTWASWHVRRGTPLQVLKGPGGWETMEMVQRYAHLSADHLAHSVAPLTAEPAPIPAAI